MGSVRIDVGDYIVDEDCPSKTLAVILEIYLDLREAIALLPM